MMELEETTTGARKRMMSARQNIDVKRRILKRLDSDTFNAVWFMFGGNRRRSFTQVYEAMNGDAAHHH